MVRFDEAWLTLAWARFHFSRLGVASSRTSKTPYQMVSNARIWRYARKSPLPLRLRWFGFRLAL